MTKLAIRCHPSVPLEELEEWLEHQVVDLRAGAPHGTIRLSRVAQPLPSGDVGVGWLLELELSARERQLIHDRLTEALRDMGLLGFQPTVLEPIEVSDWMEARNSSATAFANRAWW